MQVNKVFSLANCLQDWSSDALTINDAFNGGYTKTPFNFKHMNLSQYIWTASTNLLNLWRLTLRIIICLIVCGNWKMNARRGN